MKVRRLTHLIRHTMEAIAVLLLMTTPQSGEASTSARCKAQCYTEYHDCAQPRRPLQPNRCGDQLRACRARCDSDTENIPSSNGTLHPKYYILAVIYAPPGAQGGGTSSSVAYGSSSALGSTVSVTNQFKENYNVSISASASPKDGILGNAQVGLSFGYGQSLSNSRALDLKKSTSAEVTYVGPAVDGIDHDRDVIWLWLNPTIQLSLTPTSAAWQLDENPQADFQYVYVGWLKEPSTMPPGVTARLQYYGITIEDYPEMLKANPFAYGTPIVDPNRFQSLNTTFPYEPPYAPGDRVPTYKFNATYSSTTSSSTAVQHEYKVGVNVSGEFKFLELWKAMAKADASWTWTNTDTRSASTSTSESASLSVGGPAYGYSGPTDIAVYYDVLFKTFVFIPIEKPYSLRGSVESDSGNPVNGKEVNLVANGVTYRTFTNAQGEYRIFGRISGPLRLKINGIETELPQLPFSREINMMLP